MCMKIVKMNAHHTRRSGSRRAQSFDLPNATQDFPRVKDA